MKSSTQRATARIAIRLRTINYDGHPAVSGWNTCRFWEQGTALVTMRLIGMADRHEVIETSGSPLSGHVVNQAVNMKVAL